MMNITSDSRIALVTGANRGIGFEVCRQLGEAGCRVVLGSRDRQRGVDAAERLSGLQGAVVSVDLDLSDSKSIEDAAAFIERQFGRLDILVNNAGTFFDDGQPASTTDLSISQRALDNNLYGTWRVTQAMVPLLSRSAHPRIVNVSSGAGSFGDPVMGLATGSGMTAYCLSKAAVNVLTVKLALELGPRNFLVNAVCPGFTATQPGTEAMGAKPVSEGAAGVVWAATLDDDGPSGGFYRDGKIIPW